MLSNGGIFSTNPGGTTINTPIAGRTPNGHGFAGNNSIDISATDLWRHGRRDWTIGNTLASPATLTLSGGLLQL